MQTTQEAHMSLYPSPCKEDLLKYCLLKYIQVVLFFSFQDFNLIDSTFTFLLYWLHAKTNLYPIIFTQVIM